MVCRFPSGQASAAVLSTSMTSDEQALQADMPYSRVVTGDEVSCRSHLCCYNLKQPARLLCSN